ncbi:MAG: F0F1 ATP synthase subunit A [Terracidiphilus sp.]
MPESLAFTRLLNHLFGPLVTSVLQTLGIHPAHPAAPIDDTFAMELLVACGLIVFFLIVRLTLSVENPNPAQQVAEMVHEFVGNQAEQVIGHGYQRFQAFVTCVGLFIVLNNLLGLVPGIITPTSQPVVPLGIAVLTFIYYNFHGVRANGLIGYLKQFAGPIWWMAPLLFPVEVISHLARMMSLTIRLYANMLASDLLALIAFSFIPFVVPVFPLALHGFVALIQAYVFMLLSMIYLGMAVSHEH